MNPVDLVIVGDMAFDRTITPRESRISFAGGAYNSSVGASLFAKYGSVGVVSKVGDDFREGVRGLVARGIDIKGLSIIPNAKTTTFTIREFDDAPRELTSELGVGALVDTGIFPEEYINVRHIHLASSHPQKYLQWLIFLKEKISPNTTISCDGNDFFISEALSEMKDALSQADMNFLNLAEYHALSVNNNGFTITKPTVLKRGKEGASYYNTSQEIHIRAPYVESVIDTSGAGDVLAGAFLAKMLRGEHVETALKSAVEAGTETVRQFGVEHIHRFSQDEIRRETTSNAERRFSAEFFTSRK